MISEISIKNFKSIEDLSLPLGRVTILIGENGSGKSNILEAIGFLGAAQAGKLDNEFLWPRGIRNVEPDLMLSAFPATLGARKRKSIDFKITSDQFEDSNKSITYFKESETKSKPHWAFSNNGMEEFNVSIRSDLLEKFLKKVNENPDSLKGEEIEKIVLRDVFDYVKKHPNEQPETLRNSAIGDYLIYCPENSILRPLGSESQIMPLGIKGEGLFPHLRTLLQGKSAKKAARLHEELKLLDWFSGINIPTGLLQGEPKLEIRDRFLTSIYLDQQSTNEGFLFILFYLVLFLSPQTPKFFAIDNADSSLNPKLCAELMRRLVKLAKENGKQVILTTHNPGLLDGLDLTDPDQKLYAVSRGVGGRTVARAVPAPIPLKKGDLPVKLSHAFLQGLLGGVPKNF